MNFAKDSIQEFREIVQKELNVELDEAKAKVWHSMLIDYFSAVVTQQMKLKK